MRWKFLIVLLMSSLGGFAQDFLRYDVVLMGKNIGHTIVQRKPEADGTVKYTLKHQSEINLLFTRKKSSLVFDVEYFNNKLVSSTVESIKDGVKEVIRVFKDGTQYLINKGSGSKTYNGDIDFSAIHLYFTEPKEKARIFSERMGQFCDFKKDKEGVYSCKLENGIVNIYHYRNGILNELEMSNHLGTIWLRLAEQK